MGAFDGAEECELVGNFLLHKLPEKYERIWLYAMMMDKQFLRRSVDQPQKKFKKYFCKLFREHDLELTVQCKRKIGNFLHVFLNVENATYYLYLKESNK